MNSSDTTQDVMRISDRGAGTLISASKRVVRAGSRVLAVLLLAVSASASDLDSYKSSGQVGERPDGYVGIVVANPDAALVAFVDQLNAQRRAGYERVATKNNTDVYTVGALAGKKLVERSRAGEIVMDNAGNWRKRK